jgi:hypothetical protein
MFTEAEKEKLAQEMKQLKSSNLKKFTSLARTAAGSRPEEVASSR